MARKELRPRPVFADPTPEVQAIAKDIESAVGAILDKDLYDYEQVSSYLAALKAQTEGIEYIAVDMPFGFTVYFTDGHIIRCHARKVFSDERDDNGMLSADPIALALEMRVCGREIGKKATSAN